jgi:hypothetical protein
MRPKRPPAAMVSGGSLLIRVETSIEPTRNAAKGFAAEQNQLVGVCNGPTPI